MQPAGGTPISSCGAPTPNPTQCSSRSSSACRHPTYLAAWSALLLPSGRYAEFIERWSSAEFAKYVAALGELANRHPHEAAQEHFNEVLAHEREFWNMSW